ncbi:MAG: Flp family type IVb pilin [Porticoccaceae bacterium]
MNKLFHSLHQKFSSFIRREDGASAIEYAIIAGLIAVAIIGAASLIGDEIATVFETIKDALAGVDAGGD